VLRFVPEKGGYIHSKGSLKYFYFLIFVCGNFDFTRAFILTRYYLIHFFFHEIYCTGGTVRNTTVDSSTFVARLSLDCSNLELETSSLRPQLSV
jgi:hypothetical protein